MESRLTVGEPTEMDHLSHCITPLMSPTCSDIEKPVTKDQKPGLKVSPAQTEDSKRGDEKQNEQKVAFEYKPGLGNALSFEGAVIDGEPAHSDGRSSQYTAKNMHEDEDPHVVAHEMPNFPDCNELHSNGRGTGRFNMIEKTENPDVESNIDRAIERMVFGSHQSATEELKTQRQRPETQSADLKTAAGPSGTGPTTYDIRLPEHSETNTIRTSMQSLNKSPVPPKTEAGQGRVFIMVSAEDGTNKTVTFAPNSCQNLDNIDEKAAETTGAIESSFP